MTSCGYGDIIPANGFEATYVGFTMLFTCGIFAYTFNSIGLIVEDYNKKNKQLQDYMDQINRYLQNNNVKPKLQIQAIKYVEYKYKSQNDLSVKEEEEVLNKLSDNIREKLIIQNNMQLISKIPILNDNFSKAFLKKLSINLHKEKNINQTDEMFNQTQFYIIEKGTIQLFKQSNKYPNNIQIIQELQKGNIFGEFEFFKNQQRSVSAKALVQCNLLSIRKCTFVKIIKQFPNDYEIFCKLKDEYLINNQQKNFYTNCYSCDKQGHLIMQCQKVHYIPNQETVILKNQFCQGQFTRKQYQRQKQKTEKCLKNLEIIQKSQIQIQKQIVLFLIQAKQTKLKTINNIIYSKNILKHLLKVIKKKKMGNLLSNQVILILMNNNYNKKTYQRKVKSKIFFFKIIKLKVQYKIKFYMKKNKNKIFVILNKLYQFKIYKKNIYKYKIKILRAN
ncbi:hypothetical protein IMG5_195700 [Ichthyophthirius multifiliis]|uniref:Cyclic nucleotide-binding domain-containing protein n=1 Tax=Ichthyophthirius multifiliis TaxID=5932 RepID=G0R4Z5_ICHMU|nr:hypothetical protein IMG5_195700 [Ichthyophthirius multifiliis]EGR27458.1 hypothetical protein IMG5_195700 [Ichthyophthirius multifiliis]|eukprot:XP_004024368.1 hypothetical protein IMG5_195700 [Ichthyophthirius multifiliis]